MNKNIEEYKNEIDNLKVDENLKKKTIQKALEMRENKRKSRFVVFKTLVACAACLMLAIGVGYIGYERYGEMSNTPINTDTGKIEILAKTDLSASGLKRVKNEEELKKLLQKGSNRSVYKGGLDIAMNTGDVVEDAEVSTESQDKKEYSSDDYSDTNKQHENVDEADIVKTDGKYIYYLISNRYVYKGKESKIVIISVDDRKIVGTIKLNEKENKYFDAEEMFLYNNKLILMYSKVSDSEDSDTTEVRTCAAIYNIADKENPKLEREVGSTGDYVDARMVGSNLYFVSNKYNYFSLIFYVSCP